MRERYNQKAADLNLNGNDILMDSEVYKNTSEDDLVKMGAGLFSFFLHDEYECKFRKMLTLEQFSDKELAGLFSNQYFDEPLKYQSGMLQFLIMQGKLKGDDADIMALQFFSPIYLLMTVCDRQPKREKECLQKLERHIRHFSRIYKGEDK